MYLTSSIVIRNTTFGETLMEIPLKLKCFCLGDNISSLLSLTVSDNAIFLNLSRAIIELSLSLFCQGFCGVLSLSSLMPAFIGFGLPLNLIDLVMQALAN